MPPGPTFDPEAPPTKQTVTDSDGNPTCGSDKFHFMVFLEVAEDAMPTADKEFHELVTYGYISSSKGTIVSSTDVSPAPTTCVARVSEKNLTREGPPGAGILTRFEKLDTAWGASEGLRKNLTAGPGARPEFDVGARCPAEI